jgi:hypothetical protein
MAIVLLKPNYPPYVCIVCGLGSSKSRKWFVDLQLAIDNYFNPVNDGAVYMCNECWDGLVREVGHKAYTVMKEEEPWEASLEITYAAEGELLRETALSGVGRTVVLEKENDGPGISSESPGELNFAVAGDDQPTENLDGESDADSDADESAPVQQFREFFGKPA